MINDKSTFYLNEPVSIHNLRSLIKNPYVDPSDIPRYKEYYEKALKGELDGINWVRVKYTCDAFGRFKPDGFCQSVMWKHARSEIAQQATVDIDAIKAFPSLALSVCQENGIQCNILLDFRRDSDSYYESLNITNTILASYNNATKSAFNKLDLAKYAFNMMMYGASVKKVQELTHGIVVPVTSKAAKFFKQWKAIAKTIIDLDKYADVIEFAKTNRLSKPDKSPYHSGCGISLILQELERQTVTRAMNWFKSRDWIVTSYEFDGFKVFSSSAKQIADEVNLMNGSLNLNMAFKVKDHPMKLSDIDWEAFGVEPFMKRAAEGIVIESDSDAVDYIFENLKDKIVYCCGIWYNRINSTFWQANAMESAISSLNFTRMHGKDKDIEKPYSRETHGCNEIFKCLKFHESKFLDAEFINNLNRLTVGRVYFMNKYFCQMGNCFKKFDDIYPILHIDEDAPEFDSYTINDPIYVDLRDNVLAMFSKDQFEGICRVMNRSLNGHITDKFWTMIDSRRDCGKSTFQHIIEKAFSAYVATGIEPPFGKSTSRQASDNAWITARELHLKRVAFTSEKASISVNGKAIEMELDGNYVKQLVNGGMDSIPLRQLYGKHQSCYLNSFLTMLVNGIPKCNPADAMKTCIVISLNKEFTNDPEKLAIGGVYIKADQTQVEKARLPEYISYLRWAILSLFNTLEPLCPTSLEVFQEEIQEMRDSVLATEMKLWRESLVIRNGAFIKQSDMIELFKAYGIAWTGTAITRWINIVVARINGVAPNDLRISKQKRIDGNREQVYDGIGLTDHGLKMLGRDIIVISELNC